MPLDLILSEIKDEYTRDNFRKILELAKSNPLFGRTWVLREVSVTAAVTNLKIPHGLTFKPRDIITVYKTGAGTLTINYDKIDADNIDITTTGAATARLLVGDLG